MTPKKLNKIYERADTAKSICPLVVELKTNLMHVRR